MYVVCQCTVYDHKQTHLPRSFTRVHVISPCPSMDIRSLLCGTPRECPFCAYNIHIPHLHTSDLRYLFHTLILSSLTRRYEQQKQAYDAGYSAGYLRQDLSPTSISANSQSGPGGSGSIASAPPLMSPRHRRRKKNPDMPRRNM